MRYTDFGKTGMKVSAMTLGTWGMGGVGWDVYDDEVKTDAIKAALETGINFFDTAPASLERKRENASLKMPLLLIRTSQQKIGLC